MKTSALVIALLVMLTVPSAGLAQSPQQAMQAIQQSHIDGNVPDANDFATVLKRDLAEYFGQTQGKPVQVQYELLRKVATQSGVSYPKYYAWVRVYDKDKLLSEGAVRLAAIDKTHFDVTDYFSSEGIAKDPDMIKRVFPALLCPEILRRAGVKVPSLTALLDLNVIQRP
ncbi:MAG: hypothetical protein ACRD3W_26295 [Terriglobales bacterium]